MANQCPFSHGICSAHFAGHCARQPASLEGVGHERYRCHPLRDLRLAVALMVALRGLLRTREILETQASHFGMNTRAGPVVLALPVTKSGQRHLSAQESVMLTDPLLLQYFGSLLPNIQSGRRLYGHHAYVFRSTFRRPHSASASRQLATVFVTQSWCYRTFS